MTTPFNFIYAGGVKINDVSADGTSWIWDNAQHTSSGYDLVTGMGSVIFTQLVSKGVFTRA